MKLALNPSRFIFFGPLRNLLQIFKLEMEALTSQNVHYWHIEVSKM